MSKKDSLSNEKKVKSKIYHAPYDMEMLPLLNSDRTGLQNYCDVTIRLNGKDYRGHKCVLGKISHYFDHLFKVEMRNGCERETITNVDKISNQAFELVLDFMYTGVIKLNETNIRDIQSVSDYLQMDGLNQMCTDFRKELRERLNNPSPLLSEDINQSTSKQAAGDHRENEDEKQKDSFFQTRRNQFSRRNVDYEQSTSSQNDQDVSLSKKLAQLLRHGVYPSITVSGDGYASCDDILSNQKFQKAVGNKTMQDIRRVVDCGNKKRFELKQVDNEWMIRAIYGHSIKAGNSGDKRAFTAPQPQYDQDVPLSKELVKLLRHGVYPSIAINSDGYASCDDILSNQKFQKAVGNKTMQDIQRVVDCGNRKRFELKQIDNEWMIRAIYGHSIQVYLTAEEQSNEGQFTEKLCQLAASVDGLTLVTEGAWQHRFVHHRTSREAYSLIEENGFLKTNNENIQFFNGIPNEKDSESETRSLSDVAILIDVKKAIRAGLQFYDSGSDFLLCSGINGMIPSSLFSHVIQLRPEWKKIA